MAVYTIGSEMDGHTYIKGPQLFKKFPAPYWRFHYCVHSNLPPTAIQSQIHPDHFPLPVS